MLWLLARRILAHSQRIPDGRMGVWAGGQHVQERRQRVRGRDVALHPGRAARRRLPHRGPRARRRAPRLSPPPASAPALAAAAAARSGPACVAAEVLALPCAFCVHERRCARADQAEAG